MLDRAASLQTHWSLRSECLPSGGCNFHFPYTSIELDFYRTSLQSAELSEIRCLFPASSWLCGSLFVSHVLCVHWPAAQTGCLKYIWLLCSSSVLSRTDMTQCRTSPHKHTHNTRPSIRVLTHSHTNACPPWHTRVWVTYEQHRGCGADAFEWCSPPPPHPQTDKKDPQGTTSVAGFEVLLQKQLKGKQMQKEMSEFIHER